MIQGLTENTGYINPKIIIYSWLKQGLEDIKQDFKRSLENDSWLYRMFGDFKVDNYSFFETSKELFTDEGKNQINLMVNFPLDKPTNNYVIVGNLEETTDGKLEVIGGRISYEKTFISSAVYSEYYDNSAFALDGTVSILIHSINQLTTELITDVFKSIIEIYKIQMESVGSSRNVGIANITHTAHDLGVTTDRNPPMFAKEIKIKFSYNSLVPPLERTKSYSIAQIKVNQRDINFTSNEC